MHLSLALELSDPIQGELRDERGATERFSGWLGLLAAIEAAMRRDLVCDARHEIGVGALPKAGAKEAGAR